MADKFIIRTEVTPVVSISDDDGDATDVIHHDIKSIGGGTIEVNASEAEGTAKWFITTKTLDAGDREDAIINASGSGRTYTDGTTGLVSDQIMAIYIKNQGPAEIILPGQNDSTCVDVLKAGECYAARLILDDVSNNINNFGIKNTGTVDTVVDIIAFIDYTP